MKEEDYLATYRRVRELLQDLPPGELRDCLTDLCADAWRLPGEEHARDQAEGLLAEARAAFHATPGKTEAKLRSVGHALGLTRGDGKRGRSFHRGMVLERWYELTRYARTLAERRAAVAALAEELGFNGPRACLLYLHRQRDEIRACLKAEPGHRLAPLLQSHLESLSTLPAKLPAR